VGEGGLAAEPLGVLAGGDEQLAGVVVADRQQPEEPGSGSTDQLGQPLVCQVELGLEQLDAAGDRLQRCLGGRQRVGQTSFLGSDLAQVVANAEVERSSSASRTGAGAVTSSALSWLMAAVRALLAPRRAVRNTGIASTIPSRRLGAAVAVPASTARAAASASIGSDLPRCRRVRRSGRSTSTTRTCWSPR
jgi:hypothetical protein